MRKYEELTAELLRRLIHYDAETGIFTWERREEQYKEDKIFNKRHAGKQIGSYNGRGYLQVRLGYRLHKLHRLAWLYVHGCWPIDQLDHINRVRDDNRLVNLREATNSQNNVNKGLRTDNTTGLKNVVWHKGAQKWMAYACAEGKQKYIGLFDDPIEAHSAAIRTSCELHGEYMDSD